MDLLTILLSKWTFTVLILSFLLYKWSTATFQFFKKRNIPFIKPVPFFGNGARIFLQKEAALDFFKRIYLHFKDQSVCGVFDTRNPIFMIRDPELIKKITVKDFDHFENHRVDSFVEMEPLIGISLFFLQNQKWKDMRTTLSPAFTGSKMRLMYEFVEECGQKATNYMKEEANKQGGAIEIDMKDLIARYTTDVVASTAFGVEMNSLSNKNNEFFKLGQKLMKFSKWTIIKMIFMTHFKTISKFFKIRVFDPKFSSYFIELVSNTMKYREENNIFRPDMIHLLMEARKGVLELTDAEKLEQNQDEILNNLQRKNRNWSDTDIIAQCFVFFIAGFETTATLVCFCAHELMENPEIQERLIDEIDVVKENLQGKSPSYEVLQGMKYLDMVLKETLRKWPPNVVLDRVCNKAYILENDLTGEKFYINKGDFIWLPVVGLHHDPKYFSNPNTFDPERFSEDNRKSIVPFSYIPFGVGPRNCIGSRFALMEAKSILYHLLSEFHFKASSKSTIPLVLTTNDFQNKPKNGFWFKLSPRK